MEASRSRQLYKSSLCGGLTHAEAKEMTYLDESVREEGNVSPSDIPALGGEIARGSETPEYLQADDINEYVEQLLQNPSDIVTDWSFSGGSIPFENQVSTVKEKRDEYVLRTLYAWEDTLEQDTIDEALGTIVNREDYRHETASDSADGHLGLVLGQYISEIDDMVEEESIVAEAYSMIGETYEASAMAAANQPLEHLPDGVRQNVFGGEDTSSDRINTRLRNMHGAGKCGDLERGHEKVLFGEEISKPGNQPTRNNSLITLGGELIGSLKYEGDTSMLALQDVTSNERQILQKGMAYRVSHPTIKEMDTERIDDNIETYPDWEFREPEMLEIRPLRYGRTAENQSIQEFRHRIDKQVQKLIQQTGRF